MNSSIESSSLGTFWSTFCDLRGEMIVSWEFGVLALGTVYTHHET